MASKLTVRPPKDNTKRNSASQPPPAPSGSSDQETLFFIASYRRRHSNRQRSHISVQSFRLHTRLLRYGCISGRMNWLANAIDHWYAVLVGNVQPISFCCVDVLVWWYSQQVRQTVGRGMVVTQRPLHWTEFVSFASLIFNAETASQLLACKYPNAMKLPFVHTWHAFKSPALLWDDLLLCDW